MTVPKESLVTFVARYSFLLMLACLGAGIYFICKPVSALASLALAGKGVGIVAIATMLWWAIFADFRPTGYLQNPWNITQRFKPNEVDNPVVEGGERLYIASQIVKCLFVGQITLAICRCLI